MKTIVLDKKPYRVLRRHRHTITVQPIDTEYPHILLVRRSVADPRRAEWRDQWGHTRDNKVTWYREVAADIFMKLGAH